MKSSVATLLSLASLAAAQNSSSFAGQLVQALQAAGLNQLATVATSIANTTRGQFIFNTLPNGNFTLFAPNDHAFVGVPSNVSGNPDILADVLSYHVLSGSFPASAFQASPNVTIGRTLLNGSTFLEGGKNQVIALQATGNGTVNILNQNTPVKVLNTTTVNNTIIHIVDSVIDVPGPLSWTLAANNLTLLTAALRQTDLFDTVETAHGITLFAPTDEALMAATRALGSAASNTTILKNILLNHVVSGSSLYSSSFLSGSGANATTAAGEPISFSVTSNGTSVSTGNSTAKVTKSDLILWSGVVHIIDTVLANNATDPSAAASASASASSAAAQSTGTVAETGPVGFTPSPTGSGSGAGQTGSTGQQTGSASSTHVGVSGLLLAAVFGALAL